MPEEAPVNDLLLIARNRERLRRVADQVEDRVVDRAASKPLEGPAEVLAARTPEMLVNAAGFGTFARVKAPDDWKTHYVTATDPAEIQDAMRVDLAWADGLRPT